MQLGNLKAKAEVYQWYTVILLVVMVALLSYAVMCVLDSFQGVNAGLLILTSPLQDAFLSILATLAIYSVSRRLDPVLAEVDFFTGLQMIGLLTFVLWLVLLYFLVVTACAVAFVAWILSPVQDIIGYFYWVILGVVALVSIWLAARSLRT
jgi:hypothetical protein